MNKKVVEKIGNNSFEKNNKTTNYDINNINNKKFNNKINKINNNKKINNNISNTNTNNNNNKRSNKKDGKKYNPFKVIKRIIIKETNIKLKTEDLKYYNLSKNIVIRERKNIENYILKNPSFLTSLISINIDDNAPNIIKTMAFAGKVANVGPMASVAGTISEYVVENCKKYNCKNIICENGGDIVIRSQRDIVVGLYAGEKSPFTGKIGFKLDYEAVSDIYSVCTSSGTVGHSISFGHSDAVVVFGKRGSISDSCATSIGNEVIGSAEAGINKGLEKFDTLKEYIDGVFIVVGDYAGKSGKIPKLVKTDKKITYGELFEMI